MRKRTRRITPPADRLATVTLRGRVAAAEASLAPMPEEPVDRAVYAPAVEAVIDEAERSARARYRQAGVVDQAGEPDDEAAWQQIQQGRPAHPQLRTWLREAVIARGVVAQARAALDRGDLPRLLRALAELKRYLDEDRRRGVKTLAATRVAAQVRRRTAAEARQTLRGALRELLDEYWIKMKRRGTQRGAARWVHHQLTTRASCAPLREEHAVLRNEDDERAIETVRGWLRRLRRAAPR